MKLMNHNKRRSEKRKIRRQQQLEHQRDEELYRLAKIDPNTIEGQGCLPLERLANEENNHPKEGVLSKIAKFFYPKSFKIYN